MEPISFIVRGEPKAQPRVKAMSFRGFVRMYTPATAKAWKGLVAQAARPFCAWGPLKGPLALTLEFQFVRPKSHLTSKGALAKNAPPEHTKKPDTDNLAKAVMDALTDCGLWEDDSQVIVVLTAKRYAPAEGVRVTISDASYKDSPTWE